MCRLQQLQPLQGLPVTPQGLGMGSPLSTWLTGPSCGWISVLTLGMAATPRMLWQEQWQLLASRYVLFITVTNVLDVCCCCINGNDPSNMGDVPVGLIIGLHCYQVILLGDVIGYHSGIRSSFTLLT